MSFGKREVKGNLGGNRQGLRLLPAIQSLRLRSAVKRFVTGGAIDMQQFRVQGGTIVEIISSSAFMAPDYTVFSGNDSRYDAWMSRITRHEGFMAQLGEYHKRRILVTFQRVDELLRQVLSALAQAQSGFQSCHVQDIPAEKIPRIESQVELIRKQIGGFFGRFHIPLPERVTPVSWLAKTNLSSVDIALEDLYPKKLKGYGEMDAEAASELTHTLQEMRKILNQLHKTLD
jgi:hypothetical protein